MPSSRSPSSSFRGFVLWVLTRLCARSALAICIKVCRVCALTVWRCPAFGRTVVIVAGVILITSAVLKTHQLIYTHPLASDPVFRSRIALVALVELELSLGLFLVLRVLLSVAQPVAGVAFTAFSGFALSEWIAGAENCGCYGSMSISPEYAALIDATVAVLLCMTSWSNRSQLATSHSRAFRGPLGAGIIAISALLLNQTAIQQGDAGIYLTRDGAVILEPSKWLGRRLPIAPFLTNSAVVSRGNWILVLVSSQCSKCQSFIAELEADGVHKLPWQDTEVGSVAVVDISANASAQLPSRYFQYRSNLRSEYSWKAIVPVLVLLRDGIVVQVLEPFA